MYIRRNGSALISSVIILSLMSLLGAMYYKMTKYNMQIESLTYNHTDRYDLNNEENDAVYEFMNNINEKLKEKGEGVTKEVLNKIVLDKIGKCTLRYNQQGDKYILKYTKSLNLDRYKAIRYKVLDNNIILVPSPVFDDIDIEFINNWKSGI